MLTFDAENHKYYWNGKEVPGVSHILKTTGITRDYERVDNFYRERGIHVHKAIELYTKGTLDEDSLDTENVLPYFNAYLAFLKKYTYTPKHSELMLYSEEYNFAGTIDQYSALDSHLGIGDFKVTENSDKAADIQMCGYAVLIKENFHQWPEFRMALELHGDETFDPLFYRTNPLIWKSVMDLYAWKVTRRTKDLKEPFYASAPPR